MYDEQGTPYKLSLALSDISWDEGSQQLYQQLVNRNLEFRDLTNLSGAPVMEGRVVITNDASHDSHAKGLPPGHPSLSCFMGIPLFLGNEMVGVAGVANRPGGYDPTIAEFLEPLTSTCATLIWALRARQRDQQAKDEQARLITGPVALLRPRRWLRLIFGRIYAEFMAASARRPAAWAKPVRSFEAQQDFALGVEDVSKTAFLALSALVSFSTVGITRQC